MKPGCSPGSCHGQVVRRDPAAGTMPPMTTRTSLPPWLLVLAACLAAACAPTFAPPAGPTRTPIAASGAVHETVPGVKAGTPTRTSPSPTQAPLRFGTLTGVVKLPPALLTENGAGLLTENGAGLLTENGAGIISDSAAQTSTKAAFQLATTVSQVPLARATVTLADAHGHAVDGPDGQPITAITDDSGQFTFSNTLPDQPLVVNVSLNAAGTLQGFALRSSDERTSNLDLVSTLCTTYIMNRYVSALTDPTSGLGKLDGGTESTTRQEAAAALAKTSVPVPKTLTTSAIIPTMKQLRALDATFDTQCEKVRVLVGAPVPSPLPS